MGVLKTSRAIMQETLIMRKLWLSCPKLLAAQCLWRQFFCATKQVANSSARFLALGVVLCVAVITSAKDMVLTELILNGRI